MEADTTHRAQMNLTNVYINDTHMTKQAWGNAMIQTIGANVVTTDYAHIRPTNANPTTLQIMNVGARQKTNNLTHLMPIPDCRGTRLDAMQRSAGCDIPHCAPLASAPNLFTKRHVKHTCVDVCAGPHLC